MQFQHREKGSPCKVSSTSVIECKIFFSTQIVHNMMPLRRSQIVKYLPREAKIPRFHGANEKLSKVLSNQIEFSWRNRCQCQNSKLSSQFCKPNTYVRWSWDFQAHTRAFIINLGDKPNSPRVEGQPLAPKRPKEYWCQCLKYHMKCQV